MNEWRQVIITVCTVVLAFAALATLMLFEHAAIRTDMNAQLAAIRNDMNAQHAGIRADMNAQHAGMRAEHAAIREQLNSVDRRTARIEGHLFGIEIPADEADVQ